MQHQAGFTLIELMIVVAIIAILAAIALPTYQDYLIRSQVSEGMVLASGAKTGVAEFYGVRGSFPANNQSAGVPNASSIVGTYVSSVEVITGGHIQVSFNTPKANAKIRSLQFELAPSQNADGGSMTWHCVSLPNKYLPATCRD